MLKLSIVIPAYNVEKYITNCIESCFYQDIDKNEFELLVIDDGSTDQTSSIIQKYAKQYGNIRYIKQEHGGAGAARNLGINNAKGTYIWFVDSDDEIEKHVISSLVENAFQQNLDVLCFDIEVIENNLSAGRYPHQHNTKNTIYTGTEFITRVNMPPSACPALFRSEFLRENDLLFITGYVYEDYDFTLRAYCLAKRIAYLSIPAYRYLVRKESVMTSSKNRNNKAQAMLRVCDSLYDFSEKHLAADTDARKTLTRKINFAFSQSLRNYSPDVFSLDEYRRKPYYPLDVSVEGELKWRLKYRLANLSLRLYLLIHKWVKR